MLVLASKIEKQTKTDSQSLNTILLKETHSVFLAVTSLINMVKILTDLWFILSSIHLGVDTLSQVTALLSSPFRFKGSLTKY